MGYDLYITRAEEHFSTQGKEITPEEWLDIVERDPTLRLRGERSWPYEAIWMGDEACGKSSYPEPWLNWRSGYIYSKSPDKPLIRKMILIARQLDAKVQGDDLEAYTWDQVIDDD